MRILVAHNVDRRRRGGMSRIMEIIHEEVEAAGHTVQWLTAEDVPRHWGRAQVRFGFPWLVFRRALAELRAGQPFDIINVHEPQALPVTLFQNRLTRLGVVLTSHGLEGRAWQVALTERRLGRGGPSLYSRLIYPATSLWQSRLALTRARLVLTLNEEDRRYLIEQLDVPAARVGRMRPGASAAFAGGARSRDYRGASELIFAGTWRENKGIADLVPAFSDLSERYPSLRLTVLGAGVPEQAVLASFPPHARARVRVIPSADDGAIAAALAAADIFVQPSLFEGTPLTLIEAMMSGLPVVATATCGMLDVVSDDETGLLVPIRSPRELSKAIARLLDSGELRQRLGSNAHAHASRQFTWPLVAHEVRGAYESLEPDVAAVPSRVGASEHRSW